MKKLFFLLAMLISATLYGAPCTQQEIDSIKDQAAKLQDDAAAFKSNVETRKQALQTRASALKATETTFKTTVSNLQTAVAKLKAVAAAIQDYSSAYTAFNSFISSLSGKFILSDADQKKANKLRTNLIQAKDTLLTVYKQNAPNTSDDLGTGVKVLQQNVATAKKALETFLKNQLKGQYVSQGTLTVNITAFVSMLKKQAATIQKDASQLQTDVQNETQSLQERKAAIEKEVNNLKCDPKKSGSAIFSSLKQAGEDLKSGDVKGFVGEIFTSQRNLGDTVTASAYMGTQLANSLTGKIGDKLGINLQIPGLNLADMTLVNVATFTRGVEGGLGKLGTGDFSGGLTELKGSFTDLGTDVPQSLGNLESELKNIGDISIENIKGLPDNLGNIGDSLGL